MQMTYAGYMQAREAVMQAARPSQKPKMLAELADRYPALHYEMCMGLALLQSTRSTDREVIYV